MITKSKLSNLNLSEIIMDSMPGLVFFFAKDGQLVAWNRKVEEVLGYSRDEFESAFASRFSVESDKEKVRQEFGNAFMKGFAEVEHTIITKSGKTIPSFTKGMVFKIADEEYLVGLSIEISELYSAREKIREQINEISKLNEILKAENVYLKDQLEFNGNKHKIIGDSESIKYILYKIKQVGPTDASVLIQGETGTGKELVARAIHEESERKNKQFIKVNCASIPENLIESELFGHEKGAFTGAIEKRIGRFELADGGTIFLDEIGELPFNLQSKLLHVLQQGEFDRIGSSRTIKTDVRIIAATNKIVEDEIKKGKFRNDLYYRLNVFPITIAPLRERKQDIPALAEYYTNFYSQKMNKSIKAITKTSLKRLMEYEWPGNIRELENVIERAIITSNGSTLIIGSLPKLEIGTTEHLTFEENEKTHIIKTLELTKWKINGNSGAAKILKINPQTLRSKMTKLGIKRN
jgi:formate hydrogenlyase transcriptional activator